jgi:hypothetical protein
MDTFEALVDRTACGGRTGLGSTVRQELAVTREWSRRMDEILLCRLCAPYLAWRGRASRQPATDSGTSQRLLLGGGMQLFIPGLRAGDLVRLGAPGSFLSRAGRA